MKKLMMIATILMMTVAASAQDGKMAVGVNVNYGTASNYSNLGFGAKFQYEFVENIRGEVSGNYFLKKDDFNVWDLNLNFHYLVGLGEKAKFYPLVGLTYMTCAVGDIEYNDPYLGKVTIEGESDGNIGFNAGAGIEYLVSPSFKVNAEVKYQYAKDSDWPVFSIGAAYVF